MGESTLPLLPGGILQYAEKVSIEITCEDGRKVRIEGTGLRVDAEVHVPYGIEIQDIPLAILPKVYLVIQQRGPESSLTVGPEEKLAAPADKRDECGCHRGCTTLPHKCEKPCRWPDCLTPSEAEELAREVMEDEPGS